MENPAGAPELPAVTVMVIETGVWVPQLSVGASNARLGCGFGFAARTRGPAKVIMLMAISATSLVIVFIILLVVWGDDWIAAVAILEKFSVGFGVLFLTCFSENCRTKFLKQVKVAVQQLASFVRPRGNEPEPVTLSWCSVRDLWFPRYTP
jgi:hypothetical protein